MAPAVVSSASLPCARSDGNPATRRRASRIVWLGALLVPALVSAGGRFGVATPTVSASSASAAQRPADPAGNNVHPSTASGFRLSGGVSGGVVDEIFSNGFEVNAAYDVTFGFDIPLGTDSVVLGSIDVPAGSYVALVRLQAETGNEQNPGNNFRFDCELSPTTESQVYRVGEEPSVERYVTYQGVATLSGPGAITFTCRDGNGHLDTVLGGKLTVISVGSIQ